MMDHPIHLHGRKMEILDELIVKKSEACDQTKCRLNDVFASDEALERLASISVGSRPLKDRSFCRQEELLQLVYLQVILLFGLHTVTWNHIVRMAWLW